MSNLIFFSLIFLSITSRLLSAFDQVAFLFKNQKLCSHPFSDPEWVPVLDLCELECKKDELCVENDELVQKCKKLPEDCVKKLDELKRQQTRRFKRIRKLSQPPTLISRTLHRY